MALEHFKTQVLLLHSQQSTLDALGAGFTDQYAVHFATTGSEALTTLGETPIHIIVSAQDLPGMSGLEALREAKKRSPDTVGILLAGERDGGDLEALVGEQEVFQIVRGAVQPDALLKIVENAARRVRMMTISESANDNVAARPSLSDTQSRLRAQDLDDTGEHIIMETMDNGASVITDATGSMRALSAAKAQVNPNSRERSVDVLVLSKDQEFIDTIRSCARGLHHVHHAITAQQAQEITARHKVGVLVTDAALAGKKVALLTQRLRTHAPRLVAIVAGRRDDGESLMELINQGQVYRFLLKPVSPGRARLAVEASVKYHLDAPDSVFANRAAEQPEKTSPPPAKPAAAAAPAPQPAKPVAAAAPPAPPAPAAQPAAGPAARIEPVLEAQIDTLARTDTFQVPPPESLALDALDDAEPRKLPLLPAAVAAALLLAIGGWYFLSGGEDDGAEQAAEQTADQAVAPAVTTPAANPSPAAAEEPYLILLDNARFARDTGRLLAPAGDNALEWYMEARLAAPDNVIVRDELAALVDQVLGMAEAAMLQNRMADVDAALQMISLADPDNARLAFLSAQRNQQRLSATLDEVRAALRGDRFEDAARALAAAGAIPGANPEIINQLKSDLSAARSAQRVEDVLVLANARLASGQLTAPSNDNARYFFALAASNAPDNTAAKQGLLIVASKLVLNARAAIDQGDYDVAANLLNEARELDPGSLELQATEQALEKSLQLQAEASRRAAAARQTASQETTTQDAAADVRRGPSTATLTNKAQAPAATTAGAPAAAGTSNDPAATDSGEAQAAQPVDRSTAQATKPAPQQPTTVPASRPVTTAAEPQAAGPQPDAQVAGPRRPATAAPDRIEQVAISQLTRSNYVAPRYPRSAQRRNVSGWVDVAFTVTTDGSVTEIEIVDSLPGTVFDEAASEAVAQWRFEPVIENGRPVSKRVAIRMSFNLQ